MAIFDGSPGRIRTYDQSLNRRLRYRCATGEYFRILSSHKTIIERNLETHSRLTGDVTYIFLLKNYATPSRAAALRPCEKGPYPLLTPPLTHRGIFLNFIWLYFHDQNEIYKCKQWHYRRRHIYFSAEKLCDPVSRRRASTLRNGSLPASHATTHAQGSISKLYLVIFSLPE